MYVLHFGHLVMTGGVDDMILLFFVEHVGQHNVT